MNYIDEHLMTGERVIYRTTMTKAMFLWPALPLVMGLRDEFLLLLGIGLAVLPLHGVYILGICRN